MSKKEAGNIGLCWAVFGGCTLMADALWIDSISAFLTGLVAIAISQLWIAVSCIKD
jgi:hypothetical protein